MKESESDVVKGLNYLKGGFASYEVPPSLASKALSVVRGENQDLERKEGV